MNAHLRPLLAVLTTLSLGACSHLGNVAGEFGASSSRTSTERVNEALVLLEAGEHERARTQLERALEQQPGDETARRLLEQIHTDPRTLLGERSTSYTVRADETMTTLAERFLGDPLLFYALSRYNDLAAPNQLHAGQVLRIPERTRLSSRAPRRAAVPPIEGLRTQTVNPAAARPATSTQGVDPNRANQLRLAALEQLNRGAVDPAVTLLRQALAYDAGSAAIQRDLARALRIQASLR